MSVDPTSLGGASAASLASRLAPATRDEHRGGLDFAGLVKDLIVDTNRAQNEAQRLSQDLAKGEADIVETVVALDKADLSLRLAVEVRNRVLAAWQEITHAGRG